MGQRILTLRSASSPGPLKLLHSCLRRRTQMRFTAVLILIGALAISAYAQRPRTMDPAKGDSAQSAPTPPPAPQTFKAKYEGGVIGYTKKQDGTLSFDDTNSRLI